jgi:hypothetical protein
MDIKQGGVTFVELECLEAIDKALFDPRYLYNLRPARVQ